MSCRSTRRARTRFEGTQINADFTQIKTKQNQPMNTAQIAILAMLIFAFLSNLNRAINGQKETAPGGYAGAVAAVVGLFLMLWCNYEAGAFSTLF